MTEKAKNYGILWLAQFQDKTKLCYPGKKLISYIIQQTLNNPLQIQDY